MTLTPITNYSAAPETAAFAEIDIPTLEQVAAELKSATADTEWGQEALSQDRDAAARAMQHLLRGETVFMARDEDGYYFAVAEEEKASTETFCYCIEQVSEDCFRCTEANGPSAKATGEYESLAAAQKAVETVAGRKLDWESGPADPVDGHGAYWAAEWATINGIPEVQS